MFPTPFGGANRIKLKPKGYLKAGLMAAILIGSIFLYVFEFSFFNVTLNLSFLFWMGVIMGLLVGGYAGYQLSKEEDELYERMRIYMICGLLAIVFMPLYLSLANRWFDFREPIKKEVEFLDSSARISERFGNLKGVSSKVDHYSVTVLLDDEPFTFRTKNDFYKDMEEGTKVVLNIRQGLLGVQYLH